MRRCHMTRPAFLTVIPTGRDGLHSQSHARPLCTRPGRDLASLRRNSFDALYCEGSGGDGKGRRPRRPSRDDDDGFQDGNIWSWFLPQWQLPRLSWRSEEDIQRRWDHQRTCTVAGVKVEGRHDLPLSVVYDITDPFIGKRPTLAEIGKAAQRLQAWYQAQGYHASQVQVVALPTRGFPVITFRATEAKLADLKLVFTEPATANDEESKDASQQSSTTSTTVKGTTRPDTVLAILGMKRGAHFRWTQEGMDRLAQSNLFTSVGGEVELQDIDKVVLYLTVTEAKYKRLEPQVGIRGDKEMFGNVKLVHSNLFGKMNHLSVDWQRRVGERMSSFRADYLDTRIDSRVPFTTRISGYREPENSWTVGNRDGAQVCVGLNPWRTGINADLCTKLERVSNLDTDVSGSANQIVTAARYDVSSMAPGKPLGYRQTLELERGFRPGATGFWKSLWDFKVYIPFVRSVIAARVTQRFGSGVPAWEKHWMGGLGTVRGYEHAELGLSAGSTIGVIELRVPLSQKLTGVVFADNLFPTMGNAFNRTTGGVGLRIDKIVALDLAWSSLRSGQLQFHIGPVLW